MLKDLLTNSLTAGLKFAHLCSPTVLSLHKNGVNSHTASLNVIPTLL